MFKGSIEEMVVASEEGGHMVPSQVRDDCWCPAHFLLCQDWVLPSQQNLDNPSKAAEANIGSLLGVSRSYHVHNLC